eukprot:2898811-Pyramimonas_sp.AAC.1
MAMMMTMRMGEGQREEEEEVNAGRCLFKAKTQHHRMVGEKWQPTHHCLFGERGIRCVFTCPAPPPIGSI